MSKIFSEKNFKRLNGLIMIYLVSITLFPFVYMIATSFSSAQAVVAGEVVLWPKDFNVTAYLNVLEQEKFWTSYANTIFYTVTATVLSLALTILCAYPLSKRNLYGGNVIMKLIVFTMFFSGGLIPNFLLMRDLNLLNTTWAMILPGAISAYNVMIMKTFFQGIPVSLEEAAKIDGLSDYGVLFRIVLPLSKPIVATIGLFVAVWMWNEWFLSLIYLSDDAKRPVSMFLRNMVLGSIMNMKSGKEMDSNAAKTIPQTLQAATIVLTSVPILCVYPFVQKYFVKGIMIGSVKG